MRSGQRINYSGMLFIVLCCVFAQSKAQFSPEKYFVKNIHLKDGLSQCVVTDILQDTMGFIWAATYDGLNRYDGTNIKIYRHQPENQLSIPSSKILKLKADNNNHLYMITNAGFCIFDCTSEKIVRAPFLKNYQPSWLCTSQNATVWMYVNKIGLLQLDSRNFKTNIVTHPSFIKNYPSEIQELICTGQQIYGIFQNGTVMRFDIKTNTFSYYTNPNLNGIINSSGLDKFGNIIYSTTESDLMYFDVRRNLFSRPAFFNHEVNFIGINGIKYIPQSDVLLLSSYGQGLFAYEYKTGQLLQIKKNNPQLPIAANYPISINSNKQGILMIGYDGMGIDILDPYVKKFIPIIKEDPDDYKTIKFVRKIVEGEQGDIFLGTSGSGLVKYNRLSQDFSFFNMQNLLTLKDNFVIELLKNNHDLWLGLNGPGVAVFDSRTMKLKKEFNVGTRPDQISNGVIWSMLDDKQGSIWIGTRENGINKVDKNTGIVTQFTSTRFPEFANNGMRCMTLLKNGTILLGTEKGLFQILPSNNSIQKVFPLATKEATSSFSSIKCIWQDESNRYWLGTDGGGIVILDQHFRFLKNISAGNYLTNNVIYAIVPQNDSTIWISSNSGISKLAWDSHLAEENAPLKVQNFDESNGLQSNEFNTGAYAKLSDGSIAFGGLNGINIFKGEDIRDNPIRPKVYINEFKVYENDYKGDRNISYTNEVFLKHFENSISLSFNTLGFSIPGKIKYQYRLLGYDKEWIQANSRNYISYTNLRSGDYEFQVKACNIDGIWSNEYTSLKIHIDTPFYKTWWFISLLTLFILQLIYLAYRYRMDQIKQREDLRILYNKELAQVEMKALRAQINPHFLFNSLNSINNYILKNDTKQASRYLVKFSQLVRNILNNSSNPFISLQEELQTIELYMLIEGMRFNNQFKYSIDILDEINSANIMIPSLLLQPYVENAIWHGLLHKEGEKHIRIKVSKQSETSVSITIEDNGVGRKMSELIEQKPKHRKSFGMELGASRLRLMNQNNDQHASVDVIDLVNDENSPLGTQIKIIIPATLFSDTSS